ncbi:AMP-binding protein, partial [Massilia phyllosphaerae]|uniref:AMP-binding protein n=1 Tax=Massilia phyllosphaerae TaxID=3106034 RepID=UPI002B1CAF4C
MVNSEFGTLVELLFYQASAESGLSGSLAFTFLSDGRSVSDELTFAELHSRAKVIAGNLQTICSKGDRVALALPMGLDYVTAFFGCIYAGLIAVPSPPVNNKRALSRFAHIIDDSDAKVAVLSSRDLKKVRDLGVEESLGNLTCKWVSMESLISGNCMWQDPDVDENDPCFLQYTSGSTTNPRGVIVRHKNILANVQMCKEVYGLRTNDRIVSWLPPHHDFGLIGGIIVPVFVGAHSILFPASVFLRSPVRWLELISRYKARMTGAPNFAYELCAKRVSLSEASALQLDSLDIVVNGAERIREETIRSFLKAFAPYGLRCASITPAYGLAENTLLVTASTMARGDVPPKIIRVDKEAFGKNTIRLSSNSDSLSHVSVGHVPAGMGLKIIEPKTLMECSEASVGEIWLAGESVSTGYWGKKHSDAFVEDSRSPTGFYLRTGDLGFLYEGELFISGRIKELIIVNGANIYPQDVEVDVENLNRGFKANGCAVVLIGDEENCEVAVFQEIDVDFSSDFYLAKTEVSIMLAESYPGLHLGAITFLKGGHLPRTSSGKIQRLKCRELFLSNEFKFVWQWKKETTGVENKKYADRDFSEKLISISEIVFSIWVEVLGVKDISLDGDFFSFGGHSLAASQIVERISTIFEIEVDIRFVFECPTISQMADRIAKSARSESHIKKVGRVNDKVKFASFAQQRLWFLAQLDPSASAAYHLPEAVRLTGKLDTQALQATLDRIVARHESLRTTFVELDGQAVQRIAAPSVGFALARIDLTALDKAQQEEQVVRLGEEERSRPFDLGTGPLIRGALLKLAEHEHVLLVTQHHIVSDGWSIGILVREVSALYSAFSQDKPDPLPELEIQYADYAHWQRNWLKGEVLEQQLG